MTATYPTIRESATVLPLDGFRVLDLTRFLSGPYCTMVLAELGADVIKVEQPHTGDDSRRLAPKIDGESYPFAMPNRSKRSVSLDLKDRARPRAVPRARRRRRPGDRELPAGRGQPPRHRLRRRRGRSATTSSTARSAASARPVRTATGRASTSWPRAWSGFLRMTGQPDGRPAKVGIAINDIAAGATAIYSIMAAQMTRQQTGRGQYMDISLVDAGLAWTVWESGAFFGAGEVPQPTGTRHRRSTPYQAYRTSDGYVTIGAANDRLWERLVDQGAGAAGVGRGRALSHPARPDGQHRRARARDRGRSRPPARPTSGSRSSTRPACPAARCSPSTRR